MRSTSMLLLDSPVNFAPLPPLSSCPFGVIASVRSRKQTVGNACGTVGLLHCALNASVSKEIPLGEHYSVVLRRLGC